MDEEGIPTMHCFSKDWVSWDFDHVLLMLCIQMKITRSRSMLTLAAVTAKVKWRIVLNP